MTTIHYTETKAWELAKKLADAELTVKRANENRGTGAESIIKAADEILADLLLNNIKEVIDGLCIHAKLLERISWEDEAETRAAREKATAKETLEEGRQNMSVLIATRILHELRSLRGRSEVEFEVDTLENQIQAAEEKLIGAMMDSGISRIGAMVLVSDGY